MIKDKLENAKIYYSLSENIKKGIEWLQNTDLKNDFNAIYNVILPFLELNEQSQIKEMLRKFLWNEYERVWGIIKQIINITF